MRVALLGPPDHPRLRRLAASFGSIGVWRADLVHLFSVQPRPVPGALGRPVHFTPLGAPAPLPWWGSRFHRLVLPSQSEARAWAQFVPLGRIVVVETEDPALEITALRAIYGESVSMARRRR